MTRQAFYPADEFVICRSADGWSLHEPGATDEAIASGDARYLVSGEGDPTEADYIAAVEALAPWAAEVIPADGGFQAFESVADAETWRRQA